MSKERLTAFIDAVLAIVMTILVLELEKPTEVSWAGLWALRQSFLAYTLSFFWLGILWRNHHNGWQQVKTISNSVVVWTLVMLFFTSFFPYTTGLVANYFHNKTAQVLYGIVIIAITIGVYGSSMSLKKIDKSLPFGLLYAVPQKAVLIDLVVKLIGLVLTATIYPPAMSIAVIINMLVMILFGGKRVK
jgi:ferrochelatase